jgi:antitoxin HicB
MTTIRRRWWREAALDHPAGFAARVAGALFLAGQVGTAEQKTTLHGLRWRSPSLLLLPERRQAQHGSFLLDLHLAAAGSIAVSRSRTGSIQRSVGCRISSVEPRRLVGTIPAAARVMLRALHAEDGGGYLAVVPDLPGCMSDGDTPAEAVQNVTAAIDEWIAEAMRLNRAVPTPTRRQVAY